MVRIGILLTRPKREQKKAELVSYKDRPWADKVLQEFVLERSRKSTACGSYKYGIPTDVAIGSCMQHQFKQQDVTVDLIRPEEVSKDRLKSNDLNFLLIYDSMESWHIDGTSDKQYHNKLKTCLKELDNVYPPLAYQDFVCSKIQYYNHLKKKNVSIIPTFTMTSKEYRKLGHDAAMKKILEYWQREELGTVLCKPEFGQEGKDVKSFEPTHQKLLSTYLKKCMNKYPGLVLQKKVKGFGRSWKCPELRMYHLGDKYKYSICDTICWSVNQRKTPKAEGGTLKAPMNRLRQRRRGS